MLCCLGAFGCTGVSNEETQVDEQRLAVAVSSCEKWTAPAGLAGVSDAEVSVGAAQKWLDFRQAREQERLLEAYRPEVVRQRYRIEQKWIDEGCLSFDQIVDVGRGLFLRNFSLGDGLGNGLGDTEGSLAGSVVAPNMRRLQQGRFGGPDATACVDCHWKGGNAGAGDRADNAFLFGDGDDIASADARNAPSLWGAGWAEIIAGEMSDELQKQVEDAKSKLLLDEKRVVELRAKGISFGVLVLRRHAQGFAINFDGLEGVDQDLVVKPFGAKGTVPDLRQMIQEAAHLHLNLQSEEVVSGVAGHFSLSLGEGENPDDPDADGVERELTEGQISSLVLFIASLDVPLPIIPTRAGSARVRGGVELDMHYAPEFIERWSHGARLFNEYNCQSCHTPLLRVSSAVYRTTSVLTGSSVELDLAKVGAKPQPQKKSDGFWIPVFSDFKRHDMGEKLASRHIEAGVPRQHYMTRRLGGLAQTAPYLHDGRATLLTEAIELHGGEAQEAATAFASANEAERASLLVFLLSLRRAASVRVR